MKHVKHYSGQRTRRYRRVPAVKIKGQWFSLSFVAIVGSKEAYKMASRAAQPQGER